METLVDIVNTLKVIGIIINIPLIIAFAYYFARAWEVRPRILPEPPKERQAVSKQAAVQLAWDDIMQKAATGSIDSLRISIVNADKLIDTLLKDAGFEAEGMLDRIKQLDPNKVKALPALIRAHRIRNSIVHDTEFQLTTQLATQTLQDYASFLREVGYIA